MTSSAAEPQKPTWVEITRSGKRFKSDGNYDVSDEQLGQAVFNFRNAPAYRRGTDGVGCADVVPWDFEHASVNGLQPDSVATVGTPAQGWILDLALRRAPDDRLALWALTRWLEPARTYVANHQYRWASITLIRDARDGQTGRRIGAQLVSVALTNSPFVVGMVPLSEGVATMPATPENAALERHLIAAYREPIESKGRPSSALLVDASGFAGRDSVERVAAALCASNAAFASVDRKEQLRRARTLVRLGLVRDSED